MVVKVLVVDDLGFFCCCVLEIFFVDGQIQVVGIVINGCEVIEQVLVLRFDVIIMDYEMLLMDGIIVVCNIMQCCLILVLMFFLLIYEGVWVILDVLDVGVVDYLLKNFEDILCNLDKVCQLFCEKVLIIVCSNCCLISLLLLFLVILFSYVLVLFFSVGVSVCVGVGVLLVLVLILVVLKCKVYWLVVIGIFIGGLVVLQWVLIQLLVNFLVLLVLIQYMLVVFIKVFVECFDKLCWINVKEVEDGDILCFGLVLLVLGGKQMMVDGCGMVCIFFGDECLNYKFCVDVIFGLVVKVYNDKVLVVVFIGMGVDGCEGVCLFKQGGSQVWVQDEVSCVIYGMLMVVVKVNLVDVVYGFDDIGWYFVEVCQ